MIRIVVDFPAPLGPRNPVTRPGSAVNETSSTATNPPYLIVSDSTLIMDLPPSECLWRQMHLTVLGCRCSRR